jgi:hypothetical protein
MVADYMSIPARGTGNQNRAMVIGMFGDPMCASRGAGCTGERYVIGGLFGAFGTGRLRVFGLFHKTNLLWLFRRFVLKRAKRLEGRGE